MGLNIEKTSTQNTLFFNSTSFINKIRDLAERVTRFMTNSLESMIDLFSLSELEFYCLNQHAISPLTDEDVKHIPQPRKLHEARQKALNQFDNVADSPNLQNQAELDENIGSSSPDSDENLASSVTPLSDELSPKDKYDLASQSWVMISGNTPFEALYQLVAQKTRVVSEDEIKQSKQDSLRSFVCEESTDDKGGHGGTLKAKVTYRGKEHHLFLKPLADTEFNNYNLLAASDRLVKSEDPDVELVSDYTATIYGRCTLGGQDYLVMQNITIGNNPKLDVKMSAHAGDDPNFCAIVNQNEHLATRGEEKPLVDTLYMKTTAKDTSFMVAHPNKLLRPFAYNQSEERFNEFLSELGNDQLREQRTKLEKLMEAISFGKIALIGGSLLFGESTFYVIDPAHMQFDPACKDKFSDEEQRNIYFGKKDANYDKQKIEFDTQKVSNVKSIAIMLRAMNEECKRRGLEVEKPSQAGYEGDNEKSEDEEIS